MYQGVAQESQKPRRRLVTMLFGALASLIAFAGKSFGIFSVRGYRTALLLGKFSWTGRGL
jgi:hypothetical protein